MIIENVANLTALPRRSQVVVAPLKLARGNGGPARIFALLPSENEGP
jgi:kynurenine formamidase